MWQNDTDVEEDFTFISPVDLLTKDVNELKLIVEEKKKQKAAEEHEKQSKEKEREKGKAIVVKDDESARKRKVNSNLADRLTLGGKFSLDWTKYKHIKHMQHLLELFHIFMTPLLIYWIWNIVYFQFQRTDMVVVGFVSTECLDCNLLSEENLYHFASFHTSRVSSLTNMCRSIFQFMHGNMPSIQSLLSVNK